jgi:hypothetical protein
MPLRSRQRGMSMIAAFVVIAVCIFLGMFAFKVGPHYFEYWTVKKVADDLANNPDLLKKPRSKINRVLNQAFRTNSLWDLKAEDTIELKKDGKRGYIVTVKYEQRANLFHNIDVVTSFDAEAGSAAP